jgi:hypothetical protein
MLLLFQFQFQNLQLILYISNRTGDEVLIERGKKFNPPELIQPDPVAESSRQVMHFHSYLPENIVPPPGSSASVNPLPELPNSSFNLQNDPVFCIFHNFLVFALLISEIKQPLSWTLFHFAMKFWSQSMETIISQRDSFPFFCSFVLYIFGYQ